MDPVSAYLVAQGVSSGANMAASALNVREARINRRFQQRMSSTAHQREVRDLRAAGLNPILSASKGASSPAGGVGVVTPPAQGLAEGLSAASQVKLNKKLQGHQVQLLDEQVNNTRANSAVAVAQARKIDAERRDIEARIPTHKSNIDLNKARESDINTRNQIITEIVKIVKPWMSQASSTSQELLDAVRGMRREFESMSTTELKRIIVPGYNSFERGQAKNRATEKAVKDKINRLRKEHRR